MINLFDLSNNRVIPSIHCHRIPWLKRIMEEFPEEYLDIYAYIFALTCPDSTMNPYVNLAEEEKEAVIVADIKPKFSLEDDMILDTIERCKKLYETPVLRAFKGAKRMLDKIAVYLDNESIIDGKDGNAMTIKSFMKELPDYWDTYRKMENILKEEQAKVRGSVRLAYDQI